MAASARSIFISLTRNSRNRTTGVSRSLSSSSASRENEIDSVDSPDSLVVAENIENDDLKSQIIRLRLPKRSATTVLEKWVSQGKQLTGSDLRDISRELRKFQRYKHALEISEWMIAHKEFEVSDSDFATRIDLMTKVFGIDCAERYFESLPPNSKTSETYTALLHVYASSKLVVQAEDLFDRALESNVPLNAITFNEMMTLYMSVGQAEKVPSIVEELKLRKVEPDLFTYNLWISSCASTMNIKEVRTILNEMVHFYGSKEDWVRYIDLVNVYLNIGNFDSIGSSSNSMVGSEKGITQREWITYDFLVILFGGFGNKDKLDQIWKSLKMTKQKMIGRNYTCIISSYLILGYLKEVSEIIDEWKQSGETQFDIHACKRLLKAFADVEMVETAKNFHQVLTDQGCYTNEL
ncbi:pentatricopeptide repeat-containing protein At5g09450, mitochondrial [Impatiens glandulifera]|uniref:pentatricopeptide repeat-containing protein At5g09450, mitochondrial n=1 Tax=Impatiens glandulifera TaxID=253017 RepID=UPI001FB0B8DF|nr:pentatricopeptide repeat-containing protein At5g09450, mitochondrial [Impatiens glandulifera]